MADAEHVKQLRQGSDTWNTWRRANKVGLSGADLSGADLSGADLGGADLSNANLSGANLRDVILGGAILRNADLSNANLSGANLRRANLSDFVDLLHAATAATETEINLSRANLRNADLIDADLSNANLGGANLSGANLSGANLSGANLSRANLSGSVLSRAYLSGARLSETVFANVDLTDVIGLETCDHRGPSVIDFRTLEKSKPLPLRFLRGVGLPNRLIDYLPSLLDHAIQYYSCFISYSAKDDDFAKRIHADLQNNGVRCWFAPHDIRGGEKLHEQIDEAIRLYDKLLLILSEASMSSEWVKTEIYNARQRELKEKRQMLFPISVVSFEYIKAWKAFDADTGKDLAREIREYFIPDFANWMDHSSYTRAFDQLMRDLKTSTKTPQVP